MKKRIVLVGNTAWSMVKFRMGLLKHLLSEGYELYVLAPKDAHVKELEALDLHYIPIIIDNQGTNPINDLKLTYQLYKLYKKIDPAIIFHYTIKPNIYGTFASRLAHKKSISVVTGLGYTFINHTLSAKVAKFLYKIAFRFSHRVWFINIYDQNQFLRHHLVEKKKCYLLPGEGIDTQKFAPLKQKRKRGGFTFVLIARLLWDKGVGEYVKAAKKIRQKYPHTSFELIGFLDAQNPKAITKEQVEDWVKKGYINYLGPKEDIRDSLANADCVVLPSYREGISMILLEAASMAKPIIASNVPGCKDIVFHNINGYLCHVKDYQDLEHQMEKMLTLPEEKREAMGKEGRRFVYEHFNQEIVIEHYIETIEENLSTPKRQRFQLTTKE